MFRATAASAAMRGEDGPNGLCNRCTHARVVTNDRGSRFTLCRLSALHPEFPKYPVIPVRRCGGFQEAGHEPDRERSEEDV